MDDQPVNDGFITADFIGGVWDGKQYCIPCLPEWRVAIIPISQYRYINKPPDKPFNYDIAIYKRILHGVYWLSRIEKNDTP